ncbi:cytochrome P450 [Karstenula rhodostoma CBS 690.94]|uniref:Cytochrome P450 n=1 Tax=Karstenula rhodostoma CBS 690.94 TaxID=1392251 RepID=A0A9P4PTE6_9PLEO|nr:cytochrome P450 [Karstenula rhodostoma CBS 690.94]
MILLIVFLVIAFYGLWSAAYLAVNLVKAKRLGFPVLIRYITPTNPLWIITGNVVIAICRRVPFGSGRFTRFYSPGWASNDRHKVHTELGNIFILVSPGGNRLYIADPHVAKEILKQRKGFPRDLRMMQMLSVFGKNVFTSGGPEWQKHRKATMVAFSDIDEMVWQESLVQADTMIQESLESDGPVRTVAEQTKLLTLNVLTKTLFAGSLARGHSKVIDGKDASLPYRDSIRRILHNVIPILVFGSSTLQSWWMPATLKRAGRAVPAFRKYVRDMIDEERAKHGGPTRTKRNLVTSLIRACEEHNPDYHHLRRFVITEDEIISNIFIYAVAGMDTTSITLATSIFFLSAHPEYQDWIAEEVECYAADGLAYNNFPKLKRCMAITLETLRLCHPVSQLIKTTGDTTKAVTINGRHVLLPLHMAIHLNMSAMQTHPDFWGTDSLPWNPRRWIVTDAPPGENLGRETLLPDTHSCYMPWAIGQHVCPGKRYSQVELVAVLARIFGEYRVAPSVDAGETGEEAAARVVRIAMDMHSKELLNEMRNPEKRGSKGDM